MSWPGLLMEMLSPNRRDQDKIIAEERFNGHPLAYVAIFFGLPLTVLALMNLTKNVIAGIVIGAALVLVAPVLLGNVVSRALAVAGIPPVYCARGYRWTSLAVRLLVVAASVALLKLYEA